MMKKQIIVWILLFVISLNAIGFRQAQAFFSFGAEIPILTQILTQTVQQVHALQTIIGSARETVSLLEEMNRGVKEVLKVAETAHIKLPMQVYDMAKQIDSATNETKRIYGEVSDKAPLFARTHYRSGVEGLYLSQDAFDYSTFLDQTGEKIKTSAIVASQASATRLTAETLGILLHAVSHGNRLTAKQLEINSTQRIENSSRESSQFESFLETHESISREMKTKGFSSLNSIGNSIGNQK